MFAVGAGAEEREFPELAKVLVLEEIAPRNSDAIHLKVSLRDKVGEQSVRFPDLVGPIHLSAANSQLFSCESNSTLATSRALAFDLDGKQSFEFAHRGYLRDCGVTEDGRLYWLLYNTVKGGVPTNLIVVLDERGAIVSEAEFSEPRDFEFKVRERQYLLPVPRAEMPG